MKYLFDRLFALLLFVLASPFMLISVIIVAIELKMYPLIIQERGLSFENHRQKIYKIRTMREHPCDNFGNVKNIFDKRYLEDYVPPFCCWLRQTGLDELPQLFNVIKGEMSLIGPRPFALTDLRIIKNEDGESYEVLNGLTSKPGITGYWQVYGSRRQGMANMVRLQKYYDMNVSFKLDAKIFLSTLPLIILGQHTDAIVVKKFKRRNGVLEKSLSQG